MKILRAANKTWSRNKQFFKERWIEETEICPVLKWGFPGDSVVKNLPAIQETQVRALAWEDPLEKEMAIHSSTIAWKILWTEGYSLWGHKESDTTERLHFTLL